VTSPLSQQGKANNFLPLSANSDHQKKMGDLPQSIYIKCDTWVLMLNIQEATFDRAMMVHDTHIMM
jgi:hypothetical protein